MEKEFGNLVNKVHYDYIIDSKKDPSLRKFLNNSEQSKLINQYIGECNPNENELFTDSHQNYEPSEPYSKSFSFLFSLIFSNLLLDKVSHRILCSSSNSSPVLKIKFL